MCSMKQQIKDKSGKIGMGPSLKAFGFIVIAVGGGYASFVCAGTS